MGEAQPSALAREALGATRPRAARRRLGRVRRVGQRRPAAPLSLSSGCQAILPLVTIKDPLSWMASMCRSPYAAHFGRGAKAAAGEHGSTGLCPSPLPATATKVAWQPKRVYKYSSLPDLWNRWYR